MGNTAATMLCMPITISRVKRTSIDGIVNGVEVQSFIDDFSTQTRNQITLVSRISVLSMSHLVWSSRQVSPWPWMLLSLLSHG